MRLTRLHQMFSVIFGHLGLVPASMPMMAQRAPHGFARDITPESAEHFQAFELRPAADSDKR